MASHTLQKNVIYEECERIKTSKPSFDVGEKFLKEISTNFRTLPTFEKSVYEEVYTKHYSLERNKKLKCYWDKYKQNIHKRVFKAFDFPDVRDLHYTIAGVIFIPSERKYTADNRKKLRPGPGVDFVGQLPIPQELLTKRGGDLKVDDKTEKKKDVSNQTE